MTSFILNWQGIYVELLPIMKIQIQTFGDISSYPSQDN